MRALLLSAYDAASHRRWREGLAATFSDIEWTQLTLPPRHFKWRTRGNALWWSIEERPSLETPFDLIVAASTVDLAALRGLVPPLSAARTVVYFHENQFAYPARGRTRDVNLLVRDVYTAAAADSIAFNSQHNRDTFFSGLDELARALPDFWPSRLKATLQRRSFVVPVGLEARWFAARHDRPRGPLSIVWNHRWEYDKAPDRFFRALEHLVERDVDFRVSVLGQRFREAPAVFASARESLGLRMRHWGYVPDRSAYEAILRSSDVVVSTALHEFQGLAMLEAAAAGCRPVAPNRLSYPEMFPAACLFEGDADDGEADALQLANALEWAAARVEEIRDDPPVNVRRFAWRALRPDYESLFRSPRATT